MQVGVPAQKRMRGKQVVKDAVNGCSSGIQVRLRSRRAVPVQEFKSKEVPKVKLVQQNLGKFSLKVQNYIHGFSKAREKVLLPRKNGCLKQTIGGDLREPGQVLESC